ncbi:hypothetical protein M8J77_025250 [Diaphorina citri]|nr:hypothetical protein M8J77_025250 [Diaphorina citri]
MFSRSDRQLASPVRFVVGHTAVLSDANNNDIGNFDDPGITSDAFNDKIGGEYNNNNGDNANEYCDNDNVMDNENDDANHGNNDEVGNMEIWTMDAII